MYDSEPNLNKQFIKFKYSKPLNKLKFEINNDFEFQRSTLRSHKKSGSKEHFDFKLNKEELGSTFNYSNSKLRFHQQVITDEINNENVKIIKDSKLKMENFSKKLKRFNRKKKALSINPTNKNKIDPQKLTFFQKNSSKEIKGSISSEKYQNLQYLAPYDNLGPQLERYINACSTKDQKYQNYKSSEFIFKARQIIKKTQLQKIKVF